MPNRKSIICVDSGDENQPPSAKNKMITSLKNSASANALNLSINDCTCPICLEILIEPVVMPCSHELCLPCFKSLIDQTNFLCPMCRMRISSWSRLAANANSLVNTDRWKQIQQAFPTEIKNRLEGKTATILAEEIEKQKTCPMPKSQSIDKLCSKPGEIRQEYQDYLKREQERIRKEKENEEKLSLEYIQRVIQEEESLPFQTYMSLISTSNQPTPIARPLSSNSNIVNQQPTTASASSSHQSQTNSERINQTANSTPSTSTDAARPSRPPPAPSTLVTPAARLKSAIPATIVEEMTESENRRQLRPRASLKRTQEEVAAIRQHLTRTQSISVASNTPVTSGGQAEQSKRTTKRKKDDTSILSTSDSHDTTHDLTQDDRQNETATASKLVRRASVRTRTRAAV